MTAGSTTLVIDAKRPRAVAAVRIELFAPVASFRDPMFPGVTRCLPVPPLSTLRGLLAAATGRVAEPVTLGVCAHADGGGVDTETYHPIASDGTNPARAGRVAPVKGGMTIRDRPFLSGVHVMLWIPDPDAGRIAAALRRPVWGLRLGRSQDLVHIRAITTVVLPAANEAVVGHALAVPGGHGDPRGVSLRLPSKVSTDRLMTRYGEYLWCAEPGGRQPVTGAHRDGDQAVWLHDAGPAGDGG
jgi:CRISPR-associated Cas5-like protein